MRTITNTFNVYSFEELSDDAKEKAIENYRNEMDFSWTDDIINTINMISKAIHCDYDYYSYDGITYKVWFTPNDFDTDIKGKRAWTYIINNFITPYEKPKTYYLNHCVYSDGRKNWSRKSKINYSLEDCPFTGYYLDCCFYSAWIAWKRNFTLNSTINDFLSILSNKLGEEWSEDNEYQYSDDRIIEMIEANDYEFLEDGRQY